MLGHTEDRNEISGQWYNQWLLYNWMNSRVFGWLRETCVPMLVKEPAEDPEPDQDDESCEALLPEQGRYYNVLPGTSPPQRRCNFVPFLAKFVM